MPNILVRICDALFCALLLRRAKLVEVVELAAVATTRAPSLSRCATMMASSWSRTWGGGSSISRLLKFQLQVEH